MNIPTIPYKPDCENDHRDQPPVTFNACKQEEEVKKKKKGKKKRSKVTPIYYKVNEDSSI